MGPLISISGEDGTRRLRTRPDASVADVRNTTGWALPHPRSEEEVTLHTYLSSIPVPSPDMGTDSFSWTVEGDSCSTYSSSKTWEVLRPRGTTQASAKHIWFSGATPKHAFHMWVTNLNRLPTRDRLSAWGMQVPLSCCICSLHPESRDHIMLSCPYSLTLWSEVARRLRCVVPNFGDWLRLFIELVVH